MQEMCTIDGVPYARIPNGKVDVEQKAMQQVFDKCPEEDAKRKKEKETSARLRIRP